MTVASVLRSAVHARLIVLACAVLLCARSASGLDPALDVSQYAHTAWRVRDGFVKGAIGPIVQTPDGYLWLGTHFGLYRFDGVRAIPWQPPAGQQLPANYIRYLLVTRDGTLWIATLKGLASWKDGKLTNYPEVAGQMIWSLLEDHEGTIWAGVDSPSGRLCAFRSGKVECYGGGSFGQGVFALYEDHKGNLWVSAATGLWRWKPGPPDLYAMPGDLYADTLIEGDSGTLLLTTPKGLKQFAGGKIQEYVLPGVTGQFRPNRFLRSRDGSLWIGTSQDLLHLHQSKTDRFGLADGLSGDGVNSLFEDREGNVWVGTLAGLDRFREYAVRRVSKNEGLSSNTSYSIQSTADGTIWIATANALNRWQNGHTTVYGWRGAPNWSGQKDEREFGAHGAVTQIADNGLTGTPRSLGLDDHGRLWVSTADGVSYFRGGRFIRVPGIAGGNIWSIAGDGHGKEWISANESLFYFALGDAVQSIPWTRLGHTGFGAEALLLDRVRGGVWLGFFDGGIAYFKDGQIRASYTAAGGLGNGRVDQLRFGSRGTLWAATEGGLSRIKDGQVTTLTSKNGLPCDEVQWSVEDDDHFVWVFQPCGLVRIAGSELDAWASDSNRNLQRTIFDNSDGVTSVVYGGYGPHVTKSPDGKIWFATADGVSVIDPRHLPHNDLPPPAHIEQITADRKVSWQNSWGDGSSTMRLPALTRDVEFDYTALSFVVPEKVHFRYKLEGRDRDWQDAGNRRQGFYSDLPPRNYRFRVMACNNSGVWNDEGATLDFVIPPAWYQTSWFRAFSPAVLIALLLSAYRLRIRQLRSQEKKLRDVIETMPTFAWTALPNGSVDFVNRNWYEYTGLSTERTIGSGWQEAVHPEDLRGHAKKWHVSLATGEPFENEVRYRPAAGGQYRWFLARAVPLRDPRGKILKWYGTSTDIEDRKRVEQLQSELGHLTRVTTLNALTASIAHEVNQPLSGIVSNASASLRFLAGDAPNLEEAREAVRDIIRDGKRAGEIITRVRALTKKTAAPREKLDLNETISEVLALIGDEAKRNSVMIRTHFTDGLSPIAGDRVQLQQVVLNLVMNAIEAMGSVSGRPRELVITTRNIDADCVQATVEDSGTGIASDAVDKIFDSFYTTKPGGMGMGLSISRSILQSHGGRLWAVGKEAPGTMFHFTVPKHHEEGAHARVT